MGSQEVSDSPDGDDKQPDEAHGDEAVASKLSRELSNWRRRRSDGRSQPGDPAMPTGKSQHEPARTIKVRGHETLVLRKSKLAPKAGPTAPPAQTEE